MLDHDLLRAQHDAGVAAQAGGGDRDCAQRAGGETVRDGGRQHDRVAEEPGREQVDGAPVDLARRPDLAEVAVAEHRELVGEAHRLRLVVGDEHRGDAGALQRFGDDVAGCRPQSGIEGGERFVEEHHPRLAGEGPRQGHALLLAAGQFVGAAGGEVGPQRHHLEQLAHGTGALLAGAAAERRAEAERDVLPHGEVREQGAVLRDEADPAPMRGHGRSRAGHGATEHADGARVGQLEAADQAQQGGLARPGRADHDRAATLRHREGDVLEDTGAAEALVDPGQFDGGGHDTLVSRERANSR